MKGSFCLNNSCANLIYHHTWLRIASFVPCRSTSRSIRCLGRQGFQIIFKEHNTQKQQNCSKTKFILDRFSSSLVNFVKLHENSVTGKSNLFLWKQNMKRKYYDNFMQLLLSRLRSITYSMMKKIGLGKWPKNEFFSLKI